MTIETKESINRAPLSIGLTGNRHAVGTSTVARQLSEILGFKYMYAGGIFRRVASTFLSELPDEERLRFVIEKAKEDKTFDARVDRLIELEANKGGVIFEGKAVVTLAKNGILPNKNATMQQLIFDVPIYSILLTCDERESAKRALFRDWCIKNNLTPDNLSYQERKKIFAGFSEVEIKNKSKTLSERRRNDRKRWKETYGINVEEPKNYDLIIDNTKKDPNETTREIILTLIKNGVIDPSMSKIYEQATKYLESEDVIK